MKRKRSELDEAHWLLCEWGAEFGYVEGIGYPPLLSEPIQGSRPVRTSPEDYAEHIGDWEALDRAVAEVGRQAQMLGMILREHYVLGHSLQRIADRWSMDAPRMRSKFDFALQAFWDSLPDAVRERQRSGKRFAVGG